MTSASSVVAPPSPETYDCEAHATRLHLEELIAHAGHYLPAQGPINVFIHHNTLHAFEDHKFDEGIKQGGQLFGCEPYLTEDQYRERLARGRIEPGDLTAVLRDELGPRADETIVSLATRLELRTAMLKHPVRSAPTAELDWFIAETTALARFRSDLPNEQRDQFVEATRHWAMREMRADDGVSDWEAFALEALWERCRSGMKSTKAVPAKSAEPRRHRDLLFEISGSDSDQLVHDVLIRFSSQFLDQGLSHWGLPHRNEGFYTAFLTLYGQSAGPPDVWLRDLPQETNRLQQARLPAIDSIAESLHELGVPESKWETFIIETLLALRGWGGMLRQIELRGDRAAFSVREGSLVEFLAVRLILERLAVAHVAREAVGYRGPLSTLRSSLAPQLPRVTPASIDQRAFNIFQVAQILGWDAGRLARLKKSEWATLTEDIESFPSFERRRVFHAAFERHYRQQALDAISIQSQQSRDRVPNPRFQVVCCLDEREESFRRHLEECAKEVETFGVAGFYGVPMYYRGAADAHFVPLCPIVIRPSHWVVEDVVYSQDKSHGRRAKARRVLGTIAHRMHVLSRTFAGGALITGLLGALATIPLVFRVLFPGMASRVRRAAGRLVEPPSQTQLRLQRSCPDPGTTNGHIGFSVDEMAAMGERMLRDIGLIDGFSRFVVFLGHGSHSLNNPHNSAYNCGACGGSAGGPNARAMAHILNDPRIRQRMHEHGLTIPDETIVIGGWHNTCNDEVTYFDLDRLSVEQREEFERMHLFVEEALDRNSHERCRRFQSAPLSMSFSAARRHVEARSGDLAQTRPELGHATNALCIIGRRSRTRNLFLDRRAFLTSYDPTQDSADGFTLTRLLSAAVPVCAGINLEYYFSHVDPTGWGCGTKLPHNVTSLLGIMDGAASDLRPGLPWQMVEMHEPVRLLFVIESTPEIMLGIMARNPGIGGLCLQDWVQVSVLSSTSNEIHVLRNGRFEKFTPEMTQLPQVGQSVDWYRGWRDHLGFATIQAGAKPSNGETTSRV